MLPNNSHRCARHMSAHLFDAETGKIPHIYAGLCPDSVNGPESRDPDCPACRQIASATPANARLLAALKACRLHFVQHVAHHIGKGEMEKAAEDEAMVAMAEVAIMSAEATPKAVRLTEEEIKAATKANALNGLVLRICRAIETAVLRKNGIEVSE